MQRNVHSIFPIPICVIDGDITFSDAVEFLQREHDMLYNDMSVLYGRISKNDYILEEKECKDLKKFILEEIEKFARDIMVWEFEKFQILQSWVSIKSSHEMHGSHYHPNSVLSAVFFYDDCDDSAAHIVFHRPDVITQLMTSFAPAYAEDKKNNSIFPWTSYNVFPKKNRLIIFPSWLNHSVNRNETFKDRKSLAVNSIPIGKFGDRQAASELDLRKIKC